MTRGGKEMAGGSSNEAQADGGRWQHHGAGGWQSELSLRVWARPSLLRTAAVGGSAKAQADGGRSQLQRVLAAGGPQMSLCVTPNSYPRAASTSLQTHILCAASLCYCHARASTTPCA
jgi:hypothetical protein